MGDVHLVQFARGLCTEMDEILGRAVNSAKDLEAEVERLRLEVELSVDLRERIEEENERLSAAVAHRDAEVEQLRKEGLSTFEALQEQGAQAERLRGERDEALRLLANATDPENAGDWDEARAEGWKFASERADDHA